MNSIDINTLCPGSNYSAQRNWLKKLAAINIIYRTSPLSTFLNLFTYSNSRAYALEILSTDLWVSVGAACKSSGHSRLGNSE